MTVHINYSYRLRSAGPTPIGTGVFVTQTFGIDKSKVLSHIATETITTTSLSMTGGGGNLVSANWQRLPYLTNEGKKVYNGTEIERPVWKNNDIMSDVT